MTDINRLQHEFLSNLQQTQAIVAIYLTNGIKLIGQIENFDSYVILLKHQTSQLVQKHAIATIVLASGAERSKLKAA